MNTGVTASPTLASCAQSEVGDEALLSDADTAAVRLFPTAAAPYGLIQIVASNVVARCEITAGSATATTSGEISIRWLAAPSTYTAWMTFELSGKTITHNSTIVDGDLNPLLGQTLANGKKIEDYIASWAAFGSPENDATTTDGRTATARIPAALTLSTVPLRNLPGPSPVAHDPDSAVRVSIGRAQCSSTDRR